MSNGTKFSFSFAGGANGNNGKAGPSTTKNALAQAGAAAPMSNLEMLMAQAKAGPSSSSSSASKKPPAALFDDEDDNQPSHPGPSLSNTAGPSRKPPGATATAPKTTQISRAERKAQSQALALDQTIFDYDSVYDSMKAAERAAEASKKLESEDRKPKYIESFLASAQTRKLDKLRAEEKMLALEREKEGDEFVDKEKFVTDAYRKQMEDVRKAEEEEKAREDALRKSKKGPGLTAFYKSMLDTDEAKHAAAVAATSAPSTSGPSLAIKPPTSKQSYDDEEEYDPFLAQEAKATKSIGNGSSKIDEESGKEVEVNDEGEVVDKRSLLKAGLNIMKKPSSTLPNSLLTSQRNGPTGEIYKSRAVGAAASHAERMERERRRLAEQLKEDEARKQREREESLRREEEEARKRREGDDGAAQKRREEARERALARKRAREEEKLGGSKKVKDE